MLLPPILAAMFTRHPPPLPALPQPLPRGQRKSHALGFGSGPSQPGARLERSGIRVPEQKSWLLVAGASGACPQRTLLQSLDVSVWELWACAGN